MQAYVVQTWGAWDDAWQQQRFHQHFNPAACQIVLDQDQPIGVICLCGPPQCLRLVAGARYLSVDTLSRHFINRHICELIQQTLAQSVTTEPAHCLQTTP